MPIDTDMIAVLFGPFGDLHRQDKRSPFVSRGLRGHQPGGRQGDGRRGRRLRVDRRRSGRPAVPRLAEEQEGLRFRPAAVPRPLLSGHAPRRDADVVQHVRSHARIAARAGETRGRLGQEPAHQLPGHVPLRLAPVGHARLAEADLDDRLAGAQEDCSGRASARASCPTCIVPPAHRARRSSRSPRPNRAGWTAKACGGRRRWASGRTYESAEMQQYLAGAIPRWRREEGELRPWHAFTTGRSGGRCRTGIRKAARRSNSPRCSTSTSASPARPARWPARRPGPRARARSTCCGTTSSRSPTAATRWPGT